MSKNINLLTTYSFPDREICGECKHYKEETNKLHGKRQIIDRFCSKCYSDRVFIVTRFEKKVEAPSCESCKRWHKPDCPCFDPQIDLSFYCKKWEKKA